MILLFLLETTSSANVDSIEGNIISDRFIVQIHKVK